MSDTQEDEQKAFLRFLSIINQVITDQISGCKFDFSQCATLEKLLVFVGTLIYKKILKKSWARSLMGNFTVPDLTVKDATIDSWMVN